MYGIEQTCANATIIYEMDCCVHLSAVYKCLWSGILYDKSSIKIGRCVTLKSLIAVSVLA